MHDQSLEKIGLVKGDITQIAVDAIVNAANSQLLGGGGVDGAIHQAAGPQLLAACKAIGGCPTGEARMTPGFSLPAKHVIHTVGPIYSDPTRDAELLRACYENSLALAAAHHLQTLAFPAISCGVYGYPLEAACRIAVDTTAQFLSHNPILEQVIFVLFSTDAYGVYQAYLKTLTS